MLTVTPSGFGRGFFFDTAVTISASSRRSGHADRSDNLYGDRARRLPGMDSAAPGFVSPFGHLPFGSVCADLRAIGSRLAQPCCSAAIVAFYYVR